MTDAIVGDVEEWDKMYAKLVTMSNGSLQTIWDSLIHYNARENYAPGISMESWAQAVYTEMDRRGMKH